MAIEVDIFIARSLHVPELLQGLLIGISSGFYNVEDGQVAQIVGGIL